MHRIDGPTAAPSLPTPNPLSGTPGFFRHGSGANYTVVSSDWCNAVQEELMSVIAAAGLSPDKTAQNQLLLAMQSYNLGRIKLLDVLHFFVDPAGNDSNDGLMPAAGPIVANTAPAGTKANGQQTANLPQLPAVSSGPLRSLQNPVSKLQVMYDSNSKPVIVWVKDGTYSMAATPGYTSGYPAVMVQGISIVGHAGIFYEGNTASPQNVHIIMDKGGGACFQAQFGGILYAEGFYCDGAVGQGTTTGALWQAVSVGMSANVTGYLIFNSIRFGWMSWAHISSSQGGIVSCQAYPLPGGTGFAGGPGNYTIAAGTGHSHIVAGSASGLIVMPSTVINVINTPSFDGGSTLNSGAGFFVWSDSGGFLWAPYMVFVSGSTTYTSGVTTPPAHCHKYLAANTGLISTVRPDGNAGGINFLPGDQPGLTATGGQYY